MTQTEMKFNEVAKTPELEHDFKKLLKKFKSLEEDFNVFKNTALSAFHKLKQDNRGIFLLSGLGIESPKIFKVKKFACKSLKGSGAASGIRVIYAYFAEQDKIEFIEIYYKGDKENEDRGRIKRLYGK